MNTKPGMTEFHLYSLGYGYPAVFSPGAPDRGEQLIAVALSKARAGEREKSSRARPARFDKTRQFSFDDDAKVNKKDSSQNSRGSSIKPVAASRSAQKNLAISMFVVKS